MSGYEVPDPILNAPFEEPKAHWAIYTGESPQQKAGRRPAMYFYRDPNALAPPPDDRSWSMAIELHLVNKIRERLAAWRRDKLPGASNTTRDLLAWWRREGRARPLFFAQLEAAETVIFLTEARHDFLQGIDVPLDEPSAEQKEAGLRAFRRYACKMATGAGKTTVMGMLAAWSILNKRADRSDARFSDTVLVVCPNVTIRRRLEELKPDRGAASVYRTQDLVRPDQMADLATGRVLVKNWHEFERRDAATPGGESARVVRTGVPVLERETVVIGAKSTSARGARYLTPEAYALQVATGRLKVLEEKRDDDGSVRKAVVEVERMKESEPAWLRRVLGRDAGGKRNLLVLNDEAHHAYRCVRGDEDDEDDAFIDDDEAEDFYRESTVWIEGLDRIHSGGRKGRGDGVGLCVDLSATPYFLGGVAKEKRFRPFPWVVSDFGLQDAIESGLVKIPQLAVRDASGASIPQYFNIWRWVMDRLSGSERGGKKSKPKPEAVLRHAHHPIAMLGGLWRQEFETRRTAAAAGGDERPPVFILVCANTQIAKVAYEWLGEGKCPEGIPPSGMQEFLNRDGERNTIRADSKVVHETDSGTAKSDEDAWMRATLDTVGMPAWPKGPEGEPLYPDGFVELAEKLRRPLDPPGRGVRCIVSVGMLTEGWDCRTVTHVVGLRPFMSQLLCEQVVGRALRRMSYETGADGRFPEETATIFGVPFELVSFKKQAGAPAEPAAKHRVRALPARAALEIRFPRVVGFAQRVSTHIEVDWDRIAPLELDPLRYVTETDVGPLMLRESDGAARYGAVRERISLSDFRAARRVQEARFELARALTHRYRMLDRCDAPAHALFPQFLAIVSRYCGEKLVVPDGADERDILIAPYWGQLLERIVAAVRPADSRALELPIYEAHRGPGSTADVDFWTSRDVRDVRLSHVNAVVADTKSWEQSAAFFLDGHPAVESFVKNAGLGFAIPYVDEDQLHDYEPDFLVRLKLPQPTTLILETKGFDRRKEVKRAAALRWVAAVNAEGGFGRWAYTMVDAPTKVAGAVSAAAVR